MANDRIPIFCTCCTTRHSGEVATTAKKLEILDGTNLEPWHVDELLKLHDLPKDSNYPVHQPSTHLKIIIALSMLFSKSEFRRE